jgi:hypothetical protein
LVAVRPVRVEAVTSRVWSRHASAPSSTHNVAAPRRRRPCTRIAPLRPPVRASPVATVPSVSTASAPPVGGGASSGISADRGPAAATPAVSVSAIASARADLMAPRPR